LIGHQHNGEATLLIPPKDIFPSSTPPKEPDGISVTSLRSSRTVPYQRPIRWQMNPSLTDLRSIRTRLSDSISNSSSSGSSGVAGIGHLSGKGIKWVGVKILDTFEPVVIFKRRRTISGLIKKLEEVSAADHAKWILKRRQKFNQMMEDLLELSMLVLRSLWCRPIDSIFLQGGLQSALQDICRRQR
jgi:hypothetical protein